MVKQFEYEFGNIFSKKNVVAVNSGTSALELAYELAGIKAGDEVISPVLTCTATNIPLVRRGAKIVFADISRDLNINIEDVKQKLTVKQKQSYSSTSEEIIVDLKSCLLYAENENHLIEDAAQAVGSEYWGRRLYLHFSPSN